MKKMKEEKKTETLRGLCMERDKDFDLCGVFVAHVPIEARIWKDKTWYHVFSYLSPFCRFFQIPAPDPAARLAILNVHLSHQLRQQQQQVLFRRSAGAAGFLSTPAAVSAPAPEPAIADNVCDGGGGNGGASLGADVDLLALASDAWTQHFTGAELASLCREAALLAMREAAASTSTSAAALSSLVAPSATTITKKTSSTTTEPASEIVVPDVAGVGQRLGGAVLRQHHLEAAASATTPLLSDPEKRAAYAAAFSLAAPRGAQSSNS
jgi:SpoVK/Ycf46/Vps4 family AAA+-type ATPase